MNNFKDINVILKLVLKHDFKALNKLVRTVSRKKVDGCLLTYEEVAILSMKTVLGLKPEEIAKILGVSRSNVYATLKRAQMKTRVAEKTIKLYEALTKPIIVNVSTGQNISELIDKIFYEADKKRIKLPLRSIEIAELLRKKGIMSSETANKKTKLIIISGLGLFTKEANKVE